MDLTQFQSRWSPTDIATVTVDRTAVNEQEPVHARGMSHGFTMRSANADDSASHSHGDGPMFSAGADLRSGVTW